ncbi:MAG: type ISP restriction/modification enzyme [Candidatus Methylumidiphilus sp.]
MSHIQTYRRELDDYRRVAGAENEGTVSQAFASLLKAEGAEHKLIFTQQHAFKSRDGAALRADGALVDRLRLVHGFWEAKDSKDDLDKEIAAKLAKGYPADNLIFEDTINAVLYQHGDEVLRIPLSDDAALQKLLDRFFGYLPRDVADFQIAKNKFLTELPQVAVALSDMLAKAYDENADFRTKAAAFLDLCKRSIGERVTQKNIDEMLIQHILTDQIFQAVFPASVFHRANHLARSVSDLELTFLRGEARQSLLSRLEPYFAAIRRTAANAVTHEDKQDFLKQVYEDFYTAYNPKDADKLGVVYTPHEAVRFIIEGCDWLAQQHFGRRLADPGMDILDPCTGTGTFIVDLIDFLRGDRQALIRKFDGEIHANEIAILPYYIACLNVEQSFYDATGSWKDFKGACFVNTLDNWGFEQTHKGAIADMFGTLTDENHERILAQNARKIPVIIGNPPYNANQHNENDNNKNDPAPKADKRIKETYLKASTAQKTKLYDPYIRFIRWASDRIGEQGIIGFVTNRSYLDSRQADGLRKVLAQEFQQIWIVDLMSDVRKNPKISGTKYNIFGIQTGVAIIFLVRNPKFEGFDIHHLALDDFMTAVEKRRWLSAHTLRLLAKAGEFAGVRPNDRGDWLNQPKHDWSGFLAIATKMVKAGKSDEAIFKSYSLGISTNRDEWVYGITNNEVSKKIRFFLKTYFSMLEGNRENETDIKLSRNLKRRLASGKREDYSNDLICNAVYRPFVQFKLYRSYLLIDERGSADKFFPDKQENIAIGTMGDAADKPFSSLVTNILADLNFLSPAAAGTKFFPLDCFAVDHTRHDNITDWALNQFRNHYPKETLDKRDIFDYVYAVLHNPNYREKYALNLKAEFPRIPFYAEFRRWADWGKHLVDLHTGYADLPGTPLTRTDTLPNKNPKQTTLTGMDPDSGTQEPLPLYEQTPKCKLKAHPGAGAIEIDAVTRLDGIPEDAWKYRLGNRSALEWVLEEYREKTPKDPTIREKFNLYRFADHKEAVIRLLAQVCQVSVETVAITESMRETGEA